MIITTLEVPFYGWGDVISLGKGFGLPMAYMWIKVNPPSPPTIKNSP